jgi:glucan phosphoethanolaminetransferase (alkaline phosphatase superfamily)
MSTKKKQETVTQKKCSGLIEWLSRSFSDRYGKPSSQRLTAFITMILICLTVLLYYITKLVVPEFIFWGLVSILLTVLGYSKSESWRSPFGKHGKEDKGEEEQV